jgi:SAM-dependent methyltransferase
MARTRFHFIDDYRALVRDLAAQYPLAEAMSRAVGGSYDALGEVEKQLLIGYGLEAAHTLVDVGCGSGRLAKALVPHLAQGRYLGTDVVQQLLDYAHEGCPPTWQFALVEDIRIPFPDNCADFACFFSVFTHLLHEETYCYLLEAQRVVKPGGRVVFSFLEYAHNWEIFESTYAVVRGGHPTVHLNTFIGRDAIEAWTRHLGMTIVEIRAATDPFVTLSRPIVYDNGVRAEGIAALGQSVCVVTNDKPAVEGPRQDARPTFDGYNITYRHG